MAFVENLGKTEIGVTRNETFKDGRYTVKVKRCVDGSEFRTGKCYLVEFEVITSTNPTVPAGSTRVWIQKCVDKETSNRALFKFFLAAQGIDVSDTAAVEAARPLADQAINASLTDGLYDGKLMTLEVVTKPNVKKPGEFSHHNWAPYKG